MNEATRLELFQMFFNPDKIAWRRSGKYMEFRIDNGQFIYDDRADLYDRFLKQYGFPRMSPEFGMRFLWGGIIALVCRVDSQQFAIQINSMAELTEWERSKFILATRDVRIISDKLLALPADSQTNPEIESLLKEVAYYRLSRTHQHGWPKKSHS